MNAPVTPVPTLDELVQIAVDNDAIGQIIATPSVGLARRIAATAVVDALDVWEFEHGVKASLPPQMLVIAMFNVLDRAWTAREEAWEVALAEDRAEGIE